MPLGDEIQRLRKGAGLSQKGLADKLGVNQSFVSRLESGENDRFGADLLFRLCDALGVECGHFRLLVPNAVAEEEAKSDATSEIVPTQPQPKPARKKKV